MRWSGCPAAEAVAAMRDALPKAKGLVKVGIVNSLGVRRDAESSGPGAAADERGRGDGHRGRDGVRDDRQRRGRQGPGSVPGRAPRRSSWPPPAQLACAERLLADGDKAEATAIYRTLIGAGQPEQIRVAADAGNAGGGGAGSNEKE